MVDKSKMLIMKEGLPKSYIKMLVEVEDRLKLVLKDKEALKKMKKTVAASVNRMKLSVGKHNEKYKLQIADYREHPENYISEEEDEESDSSDDSDEDDSDEDEDERAPSTNRAITAKKAAKVYLWLTFSCLCSRYDSYSS